MSAASPAPMKRKMSAEEADESPRRSQRSRKQPERLRPASTLPSELSTLVHDVAQDVAAKSKVPFGPDVVGALEDALEDVLPRVFEAAMANARKEKRDNITVKDIQAVQKSIKAGN